MFVSWGHKYAQKNLGVVTHRCGNCGEDRDFAMSVTYKVSHLWYVIRWVSDKAYRMHCMVCQGVEVLSAKAVEAGRKTRIFPIMDQYGWAMSLAALAVLVSGALVVEASNKKSDLALIDHMAAGDIIEVNLAKLSDTPESSIMYSTLRVTNVGPEGVEVVLPRQYANKESMIDDDLASGKAATAAYYTDERAVFPLETLKQLRRSGDIWAIKR